MTAHQDMLRMLLARRGAAELPAGYRAVEFIQSGGEQVINTGFSFSGNRLVFNAEAWWQARSGEDDLFGTGVYGRNNVVLGAISSDHWFLYTRYRSSVPVDGSIPRPTADAKQTLSFTLDKAAVSRSFTVDGSTSTSDTYNTDSTASQNLVLFAGGANYKLGHYKLYRAEIIEDGIAMRRFVPCVREADSKPGLYDLCGFAASDTGTPFYTNNGTGADFTWGELQQGE